MSLAISFLCYDLGDKVTSAIYNADFSNTWSCDTDALFSFLNFKSQSISNMDKNCLLPWIFRYLKAYNVWTGNEFSTSLSILFILLKISNKFHYIQFDTYLISLIYGKYSFWTFKIFATIFFHFYFQINRHNRWNKKWENICWKMPNYVVNKQDYNSNGIE